jgi:hypothetical protein
MADHAHLDQPADGEIAARVGATAGPNLAAAISHEGTDAGPTSIGGPMAGARRGPRSASGCEQAQQNPPVDLDAIKILNA